MEAAASYASDLEEALARKQANLETMVLPQMLESFRLLLATFEGMHNILLRKGMVREDPYKHEDRFSEIKVPTRDHFPAGEVSEQLSVRLSQYHTQLGFVINYVEFKVNHLNLARLKQLTALLRYLDFANLSETSSSATTAGLAVLVDRVAKGSDHVSIGIIKDTVSRMAELIRRIFKGVADAVLYQRELYKLDLRKLVAATPLPAGRSGDALVEALKGAAQAAGLPVLPDLAAEVIAEDHPEKPETGAELRAKVLSRLAVEKKKEEKAASKGPTPRELLADAMRLITTAEAPLRSALKLIRDTEEALASQPLSLGQRIRRFFSRAAGMKERDKIYEIEYMDDSRGETRVEKLAWGQFCAEITGRLKTLHGLGQRGGTEQQRLEAASDEEVFGLLTRLGADLVRACRRLEGLSSLFRSRMSAVHRTTFRGVHGDLTMIRAALSKANHQKHEYVARMEEETQFKKLGIAPRI